MSAAGVYCNSIGLETPKQLGMVERHGGLWKKVAAKVVQEREIKEPRWTKIMSTDVNAVVNGQNRAGGLSPAQWAVGRQSRHAGEQGDAETGHVLNTLEKRVDPTTEFAETMRIRHIAKKDYIQVDS